MFKKTLLLAGASYFIVNKKAYLSPEPPVSMLLRGAYQNKIRRYSPPQKIFDVFATIYDNGKLLMNLRDLLRAICFYNYSLSDQSDTEGFNPKSILKFLGSEDRFEIYDYFLLVRFLAFERKKIQEYFKTNSITQINKEQFKDRKYILIAVLKRKICYDYVAHIKQSILIQSRQFKPSKQDFQKKIQTVANNLFKDKKTYKFEEIVDFKKNMIKELFQFEFLMFPIKEGNIDGVDFARSIVKYVETNKKKKFMKRIKQMQWLQKTKIDKQAYVGFHLYMQTNIQELQEVLNKKGAVSPQQFTNLINSYVTKEYTVTKDEIKVITQLLDVDNSGFLQKRQILGVLGNLQYYTTRVSGQLTFVESLKADFEKVKQKLFKMKEVWDQ